MPQRVCQTSVHLQVVPKRGGEVDVSLCDLHREQTHNVNVSLVVTVIPLY